MDSLYLPDQKYLSHYEYVVEDVRQSFPPVCEVSEVKKEAFYAMDTLEGWCTSEKASILIDLILSRRSSVIVEIGVFGGKSLIPMAYALKNQGFGKIYGIDPWSSVQSIEGMEGVNKEWWAELNHEAIFLGLQKQIDLFGLNEQILLIQSSSAAAAPIYEIDLLHIDGNHSEESSYLDVVKWTPYVKRGGIIIFDDVSWGTTSKAVDWLNEHYTLISYFSDFNLWGVWLKV